MIDRLVAWLDAGRRGDREALLALLAPDATGQGVRPEPRCDSPEEVVAMRLDRSARIGEVDAVELAGATPALRAGSLAAVDPLLRSGVRIAFASASDGRISGVQADTPVPFDPRWLP